MQSSPVTDDDDRVDCAIERREDDVDADDQHDINYFEPSLFAEFHPPPQAQSHPVPQWPRDVDTAFLAANLLLLYLNLARLSTMPTTDDARRPLPTAVVDRDDHDGDRNEWVFLLSFIGIYFILLFIRRDTIRWYTCKQSELKSVLFYFLKNLFCVLNLSKKHHMIINERVHIIFHFKHDSLAYLNRAPDLYSENMRKLHV